MVAARATFALEIALTAFARRWPNPQTFLTAARDIVTARPDAPGARPDDDRFELRFHRGRCGDTRRRGWAHMRSRPT